MRQLHELINEIFVAKTKYDHKCAEASMPNETMEEYMYTFLNQKYGLRSLTISWASSLINGIKVYSKSDFETLQFGKILRGKVSEYHRFFSQQIKDQTAIILRQTLNEKYQPLHKTEEYISSHFNQILSGAATVEPWMMQKLLDKLESYTKANASDESQRLGHKRIEALLIHRVNGV